MPGWRRPTRRACSTRGSRRRWYWAPSTLRRCTRCWSLPGWPGSAVYDGLVALAAREHGAWLATRNARARGTCDAVGVTVIIAPW